jgi:hypothetical protein
MRWNEIISETLTLKWKEPRQAQHAIVSGAEVVVNVDVSKINSSWSKDSDHFISGPDSRNAIGRRYDNFGQWLNKGEAIEMSEVGLDYRGEIYFTNGRHRFAYLRDQGVKNVPVVVPVEQAEEIKKRFG